MKKTNIMLAGALVALTACDDNYWNEHNLDGFDGDETTTVVKKVEYTLTDTDYSTIAGLSENVTLAGEADADALAALKTTHCFTDVITPEEYIPAFLASSKFEYWLLDNGSRVTVTYNIAEEVPAEIAAIQEASKYTVSTAAYQEAWGSDEDYISAFTPSVKPTSYIPALLADEGLDTEYAIVTYKYSEQEPIFQTVNGDPEPEPEPTYSQYMIVAGGFAATALNETYSYGYLPVVEVDEDNLTFDDETTLFTFVPSVDGYYIIDCYDRYLYQAGTYNSFNVSANMPEDGAQWEVTIQDDGTAKITNVDMLKYIQYSEKYTSYGSYAEMQDEAIMPKLYEKPTAAKAAAQQSRGAIVDVPTTTVYALYHYSSGKWSQVTDVAVLQPEDYTLMGSGSNYVSSTNAAAYLPKYMDLNYPYAADEDTKIVAYFTSSSGAVGATQLIYTADEWVVDDFMTEASLKFGKVDGVWSSNIALDEYTHVKVGELISGEVYIIVTDEYAANNLSESYTYGYLKTTTVEFDMTHINLPDDSNCQFTFTETADGWTIQDQYGKYYYLTGTYNSYNVSLTMPDEGAYWDVIFQSDGTVNIYNKLKEKTVQYDENYGSYGCYSTITHTLPSLYRAVGEGE
ncbi:MAG: hypothetical protein LIP03_01905 [Bacteroidales bacterium]|nr:hypothetical protein [Bacteroidales bacterium]